LVYLLRHKTDGGGTAWDTHRDLAACVRLKASRARGPKSGLNTGVGVTTGGARDTIAKVASGSSGRRTGRCDGLRRDQVKDRRIDATGCVGPCYHYFVIFYVLDHKSILVF
jgi:hypothetical protein